MTTPRAANLPDRETETGNGSTDARTESNVRPSRSTLIAALGYIAIVVVLFHRLLLGEVLSPAANLWADPPFRSDLTEVIDPYLNGIQGDVWRAVEPWHIYQYRAARDGRFPLWNPHSFCGFPFHANGQSAMLSPFHWVYFFADPKWAAGPVAGLKLWLAGFATFCLARRLGFVPVGAFLSGAAFMLSAFNVRWLLWTLSSGAVWMPVVLIALDRLIECISWRRLAIAGLAATVLQLTGHPETQFHVGVLSGLYVVLRVALRHESPSARMGRIGVCLVAHILGVCGAAISLWPFAEQLPSSLDWLEPTRLIGRHLPVDGLLGAVAPDHFGRPRASRFYQGPLNYVEAGLYIGLMPLAWAVVALVRIVLEPGRTRKEGAGAAIVIFSVWLLVCGVIVFGVPGVPVLLNRLPLFSKADNMRLLLGLQFAGAMLAGAAWTQWSVEPTRLANWTLRIVVVALAGGLGILLLAPGDERDPDAPGLVGLYAHRDGLIQLWTDPSVPAPLEHRSLRTLVSFLFAVAGVLWLWLWRLRQAPRTKFAGAGLLLITLGDLMWVAYGFNPTVPPRVVFPDPPARFRRLLAELGGGRLAATGEILSPNLSMVYGFRDLRGYDFPLDAVWAKLFQRLRWNPGMPLVPSHQVTPCLYPELQSLFDKTCVRFVVTKWDMKGQAPPPELSLCERDGLDETNPKWRLVRRPANRAEEVVYENTNAYPRVYFAEQVLEAPVSAAIDSVLDVAHDFRAQSFVEQMPSELANSHPARKSADAEIEHDGSDEVNVRTRSGAAGLLVLSDRYDAGWRVEIDGTPAPALRANGLFRGVVVPAGQHHVRWFYRPASFVWGRAASIITLAALVLLAGVGGKRRSHET